jgi:hypothetical protein
MDTKLAKERLDELEMFLDTGSTFDAADGALTLAKELLKTLVAMESGDLLYIRHSTNITERDVLLYHPGFYTAEPISNPRPVGEIFRDALYGARPDDEVE